MDTTLLLNRPFHGFFFNFDFDQLLKLWVNTSKKRLKISRDLSVEN